MSDHMVNYNLVTEPTVVLAPAYSSSSAHSCHDDSTHYAKRYRSDSVVYSSLPPRPSPALNAFSSVFRRRSITQKSDEDATTQFSDSTIVSATRYSGMDFAEFLHEGQVQNKNKQMAFPPTTKMGREQPFLESPILSQDNHVSPLSFNAEMLQLLHLSQSNAIPGQKKVEQSHGQVSAKMTANRRLSAWPTKYKHQDSSYSCIDSVRRVIPRAAKHKANDIVRRQALSIKRFVKSHINVANLDVQEQALLGFSYQIRPYYWGYYVINEASSRPSQKRPDEQGTHGFDKHRAYYFATGIEGA